MGLVHFAGVPCQTGTYLWACEKNLQSLYELGMATSPPTCRFSDICDFILPAVHGLLKEQFTRMHCSDLQDLFMHAEKKVISSKAKCQVHDGLCEAVRADVHIAGTPCVNWSPRGDQSGLAGASGLAFFVWIAQRRLHQEDAVLHENVTQFQVEILEVLLGDLFIIWTCELEALTFASLSARHRRYSWLLHKRVAGSAMQIPREPWGNDFVRQFFRDLDMDCSALWGIASDDEIQALLCLPVSRWLCL